MNALCFKRFGTVFSVLMHLGVLAALSLTSPGPPPVDPPPEPVEIVVIEPAAVTAAPPAPLVPPSAPAPRAAPPIQPPSPQKAASLRRPSAPVQTAVSGPDIPQAVAGGGPPAPESGGTTADGGGGIGAGSGETGSGTGLAEQAADPMPPYLAQVRQIIQDHLIYPEAARRWGVQGTVHLRFRIDSQGAIDLDHLIFPLPDEPALLRQGAVATLAAVGTVPPPPLGAMTAEIPLRYQRTPR